MTKDGTQSSVWIQIRRLDPGLLPEMDDIAEYRSAVWDQYLSVTVTDIQIFSRQNWKL